MNLLLSIIAGWTLTRAAIRWWATIRALGPRGAWRGVRLMVGIRIGQCRRPSAGFVWPIPPTTPLLNEIAIGLLGLLGAVLLPEISVGGVFRWLALPAHYIPIALWVLARTAENVLPATGLYLGVSEPGQYDTLIEIGHRNRWLMVTALNAADYAVTQDLVVKHGHISALLSPLRLKGMPIGVIFERRRLESVRTADDVWQRVIERLMHSVQILVIDGRSWSTIVETELVWALEVDPEIRLVIVTRNDGSTIFDNALAQLGLRLVDLGGKAVPGDEAVLALDNVLARHRMRRQPGQIRPEGRTRLAALLCQRADRTRTLLSRIDASTRADHDLDLAIAEWAEMNFGDRVASYTGSLPVAIKLVRDRLDHPSLSIHQSIHGRFRVEIAAQPVPNSWRFTTTQPAWFTEAAPAVLHCLLRAELGEGKALAQSSLDGLWRIPPGYLDDSILQSDDVRVSLLNKLYQALSLRPDELDMSFRKELLTWVADAFADANASDELLTDVERTLRLFVDRMSVDLQIDTGGNARAEVGMRGALGWLVTNSDDAPDKVYGTLSLAMFRAALKLDLGLYEKSSRRRLPENPQALTTGAPSPFGREHLVDRI